MNNIEVIKNFWNTQYKDMEVVKVTKKDFTIDCDYDKDLKFLGDNAEKILDFGCGVGFVLLEPFALGSKAKHGLGIDPSQNVYEYNQQIKSNFPQVDFMVGDQESLKAIPDESYDGIICSNVIDVMPKELSEIVIKEFKRILSKNGYLLLKTNFYLTPEILKRISFEKKNDNEYYLDGVLRCVNYTTDEWIEKMKPLKIVKTHEFERIPNGPKDRLYLFQK